MLPGEGGAFTGFYNSVAVFGGNLSSPHQV